MFLDELARTDTNKFENADEVVHGGPNGQNCDKFQKEARLLYKRSLDN